MRKVYYILGGGLLGLASLIAINSCSRKTAEPLPKEQEAVIQTEDAEPQPSLEEVLETSEQKEELPQISFNENVLKDSDETDLTDFIIEEYKKTNNDKNIRLYADLLENKKENYYGAFELYEAMNNKEGMQRTAKKFFIEGWYLNVGEDIIKRSGLKLTPDLYNERGDYTLRKGWYDDAFEAYKNAGNIEGVNSVLKKIAEQ